MKLLAIDTIKVHPERQRKEFDEAKLASLAKSIQDNGLINAITVETYEKPYLVTGERRLRALTDKVGNYKYSGTPITKGFIPCVAQGELTEEEREACELAENLDRENLTWQEVVNAQARLHTLRSWQASGRKEVQTFKDTAIELAGEKSISTMQQEVRTATILQPFMEDPEVKNAKTEKEAYNIVRKKLQQEFNVALAQRFDVDKIKSENKLIVGSCTSILPTLDLGQFDVIITDPPYGINAHTMAPLSGSRSGVMHEYEDTLENATKVWESIFYFGGKACKLQAHLYMFCDFRHWWTLVNLAELAGWQVWPTPIIWHKPTGGMLGDSTHGPRKSYETILYASKGNKTLQGVYLDVIIANPTDSSLHAAAKPVEVYENLLRRSCIPGDRVLDPCCGSGTIFPAANRRRVVATGIELSQIHASLAATRINGED